MTIKISRIWIIVGVLALAVLAVGLVGVLPTYSQPQTAAQAQSVANVVGEAINYQGLLADDAGNPLDGSYEMRFFLYDDPVTGNLLFDSGAMNVTADNGLFSVSLNAPQTAFDGRELWLSIQVDGEVLSPRQEIQPAPYAMSLRPGAVVRNAATGTAVRIES